MEEAGFGPTLDRVADAWRTACAAQAAGAAERDKGSVAPERKRPLIFAVPQFGPPRKRTK
jgi:hypothetical protein